MPRVAELRQRIFLQPPGDYMLRALDVTREGWIRDLPADRPAMVIAEGVFCYLEPENVTRVFRDVADYFPSGQIAFDKMGTLSISLMSWVQFLKGSKSAFQWGIDEPKTIERFHPRLKVKDCVNKKDFMVRSAYYSLPTSTRDRGQSLTSSSCPGRLYPDLREDEFSRFPAPRGQIQWAVSTRWVLKERTT